MRMLSPHPHIISYLGHVEDSLQGSPSAPEAEPRFELTSSMLPRGASGFCPHVLPCSEPLLAAASRAIS